ncbi:dethiobiotin synthase [Coxiella endosymbiont of Amblyomma nuttalli]|uniref:dethiobiotin synthase n=1 Tax=Coxiella endosymbiont of Amblyomma nuttalli TaxID=2749996 RepID=UPI001BAC5573|nr:dethiobiotin synthase [Coxiella endosymbiont of Amblyomma nuttalli]QTS83922.1 ATP-dependent dethiobiotin synthetase BioD 1 [Coxiella endosymbiont of Amblyomma nuttalli]
MAFKFFITGTDTGIGKTYVSVALLRKFNNEGFSTFGMKPIASGCHRINHKLYNKDALALQKVSSIKKAYEYINPFAFEAPIAPHIASQLNNQSVEKHKVVDIINRTFRIPADVFVIEGVGGWFVPLNEKELMSDVVKLLNIPVILVVGIRLGCLNHALLTVAAIRQAKIPLVGWVANCLQPDMSVLAENIETLKNQIRASCLAVLPRGDKAEDYFSDYFSNVVSPEEKTF